MTELNFETARFWPRGVPPDVRTPQTTLCANLEIAARRYPDKPAYVVYGETICYLQLLQEAERVAGWLQLHGGVEPGDRVIVSGQSSARFVTAYHGILRADAVVVPVNPMNLAAEFAHIASDSGAKVAIVAQDLLPALLPLLGHGLNHIVAYGYSRDPSSLAPDVPGWFAAPERPVANFNVTLLDDVLAAALTPRPAMAAPEDLCLIAYTSGTTAYPKGVTHNHLSLMRGAITPPIWYRDSAASVFLGASPMFHIQGLQSAINTPVYLGATTVVLPRWDAQRAANLLSRHAITRWGASPAMVLDLLALGDSGTSSLRSVGRLTGGGAALPEAVVQRLREDIGIEYVEGYGMTETAAMVFANPPERSKRQCIGIPTFGVSALLADPVAMVPHPEAQIGAAGELWVAGEQVTPFGYWGNDEANRSSFVTLNGKRWLRTGDMVSRDEDGYFHLVDRLKRMINSAGYKVWPTEVEAVLYRHPEVREACVIAAPDPRRGDRVRAVVVRTTGSRLTAEELVQWSRGEMAVYKCPSEVEFVDQLPRSGVGKIDWRRLQEAAFSQATPSAS